MLCILVQPKNILTLFYVKDISLRYYFKFSILKTKCKEHVSVPPIKRAFKETCFTCPLKASFLETLDHLLGAFESVCLCVCVGGDGIDRGRGGFT